MLVLHSTPLMHGLPGEPTPNRTSNTTRLDYANDLTAPAQKEI